MVALRAHARGGPEQLRVEQAPVPDAVPPSVLVRVHAAAITFGELVWDETWTRDGQDRTPIIPSHEWSGVVEQAPPESGLRAGQPVFGMVPFDRDGAAAEYVSVPPDHIAPKPENLTHVEAAALPLAGLTAWQALGEHGHVGAGHRVLVLGAAGGVGAFAVQLALRLGAEVTATALAKDRAYVQQLGPVQVVTSERGSHPTDVGTGDYDVVVDTVGGPSLGQGIGLARAGGTFITLQEPPPPEPLEASGVTGVFFVVRPTRAALDQVADLARRGGLRVTVAATFPLAEGRRAFESGTLPNRRPGKTVLVVNEDQ